MNRTQDITMHELKSELLYQFGLRRELGDIWEDGETVVMEVWVDDTFGKFYICEDGTVDYIDSNHQDRTWKLGESLEDAFW